MANIIPLLPELDERGLNVKIVCAASPQLFALQPEAYRRSVLRRPTVDSTVITTQARWLMHDWLFNRSPRSTRSPPTGTTAGAPAAVDEVLDEAHLSPEWILKGIERSCATAGAAGAPAAMSWSSAGIDS